MISSKWCFLVTYCIILELSYASDSYDVVSDFISVFNGNWDNRAGVQAGLATDVIEARFVPVDIPAFRPKTMLFFENALNGTVFSLYICEVILDKNNHNMVLLVPYNFTGSRTYKTGEYNISDLSTLTPADIKDYKRCTVSFQKTVDGAFSGRCPHCNHTINEHILPALCGIFPQCLTYDTDDISNCWAHPACSLTFTCDSYTVIRHPSAVHFSRPSSEVFHLRGSRYPLINTPDGYKSPCEQRT